MDYNKKLQSEEINPNSYSSYDLQLNYNSGIKHEYWEGAEYCLNFYNGVYIAKCFDDILEFLILWQFLVSEMLILEVPQTLLPTTIGLFYIKDHNFRNESLLLDEKIKSINLENFSCDDLYYLPENYILSKEHCLMCKEYLNKKIYPSAKLGLFIGKHFSTYEEITQQKALFIAWLAIFVSIALTFAPLYLQKDNSNIDVIIQNLNDIKSSVNKIQSFEDLSIKIDIIIDKLNILSDKISSKNINIDFVESDIASKQ